jgi:type VI secretion system secreted protein Hcp
MISGYMLIDEIKGESLAQEYEEQIDLYNINWTVTQPVQMQHGTGRTQGRSNINQLYVWKFVDAATPYLSQSAMNGTSFATVTVTVVKDSGGEKLPYMIYTLENVTIATYELQGAPEGADDQTMREKIGLAFEKVTQKLVVQADDHSAGAEHETVFSVTERA